MNQMNKPLRAKPSLEKSEDWLERELGALDLRDNIPPQMLAVISGVLAAIDQLEKGDSHES